MTALSSSSNGFSSISNWERSLLSCHRFCYFPQLYGPGHWSPISTLMICGLYRIELSHPSSAVHSGSFNDQSGFRWLSIQFEIRLHRLNKISLSDPGLRTPDLCNQAINHSRSQHNRISLSARLSSSPLTINPITPFISNISMCSDGRDKQSALWSTRGRVRTS